MKTKHSLDFEVAEYPYNITEQKFLLFRVGTCEGLWCSTDNTYDILAINNKSKGNGHFEDVLQRFESSCKRDKKKLRFLEIMNEDFKNHLINKRGFKIDNKVNCIKKFR